MRCVKHACLGDHVHRQGARAASVPIRMQDQVVGDVGVYALRASYARPLQELVISRPTWTWQHLCNASCAGMGILVLAWHQQPAHGTPRQAA